MNEQLQILIESIKSSFDEQYSPFYCRYQKQSFLYDSNYQYNSKLNDLIRKLIYIDQPIPNNVELVINKILLDCASIYKALLPLYELHLPFSISLVGGAARDILLDNVEKIKDLDISISVEAYFFEKINQKKLNETLLKLGLDTSKIKDWNTKGKTKAQKTHELYNTFKIYTIVHFLLKKHFELTNTYPPRKSDIETYKKKKENNLNQQSDDDVPPYLHDKLHGVIKIDTTFSYPVDILISNYTTDHLLEGFDFNLCKAGFIVVDKDFLQNHTIHFPMNAKEFLYNYYPNEDFLIDVKNCTNTMYFDYKNHTSIELSITKHLPRIEAKYPQYKTIFSYSKQTIKNEDKDYHAKNSIVQYYTLQKKVPNKENITVKKTKI